MRVRCCLAILVFSTASGFWSRIAAQTVRGGVVEEITRRPVAAAEVLLVDSAGRVVATTVSGEDGEFALAAPEPGLLRVRVVSERFAILDTPPLRVGSGQELQLELQLIPEAVDIPGLEVTVDPLARIRTELGNRGLLLDDLGRRFIDLPEIEKRFSARDVGEVISSHSLPGVSMIRPENVWGSGVNRYLCVTMLRSRTGTGLSRCALVVLDGTAVSLAAAMDVPAENLKAVMILRPAEATLIYGTMGGSGAVLLFTRSGPGR